MEQGRIPKPGEIYKHFKDMHYQIITVATHSENRELMVVYQALYGDFKTYVRPLEMFVSEVDHIKYPEAKQKYRFELERSFEDILNSNKERKEEITKAEKTKEGEAAYHQEHENTVIDKNIAQENERYPQPEKGLERTIPAAVLIEQDHTIMSFSQGSSVEAAEEVNSILLDFLEETSYSKKLEVLLLHKKHLNDRLVNDMAVALDIAVDEGPLEERIQGLVNCLSALSRFEHRRIR